MKVGFEYFSENEIGGVALPPLGSNLAGTAGFHFRRPSALQPVPHIACRRVNLNGGLRT